MFTNLYYTTRSYTLEHHIRRFIVAKYQILHKSYPNQFKAYLSPGISETIYGEHESKK
jgi:hypothetical protein